MNYITFVFDKIFYTLSNFVVPIPVADGVIFRLNGLILFLVVSILSIFIYIFMKFAGYESDLIFRSAGNRLFNNMGFGMNTTDKIKKKE